MLEPSVETCLKCRASYLHDSKYYLLSSFAGMEVAVCKDCWMKGNK
jgi:hypothetical protein